MKRRNPYPVGNIMHSNLHSFGMLMKARMFSSEQYRFGFNGKEKTDEVNGDGAVYDYGYRIYDLRLGKFLSVDPISKDYPMLSPYQFASLNPIKYIDLDGLEGADMKYESVYSAQFIGGQGMSQADKQIYSNAMDSWILPAAAAVASELVVGEAVGWAVMKIVGKVAPKTIPAVVTTPITQTAKTVVKTETKAAQTVVKAEETANAAEKTASTSKSVNKLEPSKEATGSHTSFKSDPKTGEVTNYAEYTPNSKNPTGFDEVKRVDLKGESHFNKTTGTDVPTPHVHGKDIPGGVRPATPKEIPSAPPANPFQSPK